MRRNGGRNSSSVNGSGKDVGPVLCSFLLLPYRSWNRKRAAANSYKEEGNRAYAGLQPQVPPLSFRKTYLGTDPRPSSFGDGVEGWVG
jgi:hypothetical protein